MLKKIIALLFFACLLLFSASCRNKQEAEELNNVEEFSNIADTEESFSSPRTDTSISPDSEESSISSESAAYNSVSKPQENERANSQDPTISKPSSPQSASTLSSAESSPVKSSEEYMQPSSEEELILDVPEPPAQTVPVVSSETPFESNSSSESEAVPQPEFDINCWITFAKNYAKSIGLILDSEAIWCWDTPIIASADSIYLERDLCGILNKYNQDEDITAVWIWAEQRTESSWNIYIGYA